MPDGPRRIELAGHTLLPGLLDMHSHLAGEEETGQGYASLVMRSGAQDAIVGVRNARLVLEAGFTTVRDVGSFRAFTDVAIREGIEQGWFPGPRMLCSGAYVTVPGGSGDITGLAVDVDAVVPAELRFGVTVGADQMRANVRRILARGADFIKVLATGAVLTSGTNPGAPEFTEDELTAAVETCEDYGSFVAAHAHGPVGIRRAVRAGVRSIEHASLIDDEALALAIEHGTYLVIDISDGDHMVEQGPALGYTDEVMRKVVWTNEVSRAMFGKAVAAGAKIANGSDTGIAPFGTEAKNLTCYVRFGMTPMQAIRSATVGRRRADPLGGPGRRDRGRVVRRSDRGSRRSDDRHHAARVGALRDEGRRGGQGHAVGAGEPAPGARSISRSSRCRGPDRSDRSDGPRPASARPSSS